MKRKTFLIATGLCAIFVLFSGCGRNKEKSTEINNNKKEFGMQIVDDTKKNINILDIVDVGDYKSIKLDQKEEKVTDADVDQAVTDALENTQVVDEGARKGDQVFVGVTGIIDNSKVSEESNDGVQLEIGKSDMPSGFDEGIVGMKPGDTKDIQLTLPKEYEKNTKLSGKNIIYRVVMNSITRSYSELTEDWLHKYTEYKTIDDYKNAVKKNLEQEKVIKKGIGNEDEIWNRLEKICTVNKYLKSEVDLAKKQYELNMDNNLNLSEIDLDTYKKQMNLSDKDYEKQKGKDIKKSVERNMIVSAIAKKEGYSIDDEESGTVISDMAEDYQMSEESFRALFEKKDLEKQVMSRRVINLITENQSNLH